MEEQEEKKEEKGLKPKSTSFIGQIVAALWIMGFGAFFIIKNVSTIKATDIILFGFAVAACFTPIYFSIVMDKIKEIKWNS